MRLLITILVFAVLILWQMWEAKKRLASPGFSRLLGVAHVLAALCFSVALFLTLVPDMF